MGGGDSKEDIKDEGEAAEPVFIPKKKKNGLNNSGLKEYGSNQSPLP